MAAVRRGAVVAVVGFGRVARSHLRALATDRRISGIVVCDIDADSRARAASAHSGASICSSVDEVFETRGLSAVFVCTPPSQRAESVLAAVEHRIPLFVEKPVALDVNEARELTTAVETNRLVNASGYQSRYGGLVPFLRQRFNGLSITQAVANRYSRPVAEGPRRNHSGGQVTDVVTHQIDLLRSLMGEVESVGGISCSAGGVAGSQSGVSADVGWLSFESGAVASFASNNASPYGNPRHLRGVSLFGVDVTASVLGHEGEPRRVEIIDRSGRRSHRFRSDVVRNQARAFLDASLSGDQSLVRSSMRNGLANLEVTDALRRSALAGGERLEVLRREPI
jgi:predicted dehydrogenase